VARHQELTLRLAGHADRQALAGKLVDDVQHPVLAPVMRAMLDEVVGPDIVGILRPQAHARAVIEPETRPHWLTSGNLEPFATPTAFDALHVHRPAVAPE
jgi:hypothetical protein